MADQVFALPKLDWPQWQARYRPAIRVQVAWDELQKPAPRVGREWVHAGWGMQLFCPWYGKRSWRTGRPRPVFLGSKDVVLVVPALKLTACAFILLDGCHRAHQLGPRCIVLDYLAVRPAQRRCFVDCFNDWVRATIDEGYQYL